VGKDEGREGNNVHPGINGWRTGDGKAKANIGEEGMLEDGGDAAGSRGGCEREPRRS
jgi:hypothetical protein